MHSTRLKTTITPNLPSLHTSQNLNSLIHASHRVDVKHALPHSLHNLLTQHQVLHITPRHHNALITLQPPSLADPIEPLNLLVNPPNRLNLTPLVHRPSHRQVLPNRQFGQSRQNSVELSARRAITIHPSIALFKDQPARDAQRLIPRILALQEPGYYQNTLGVNLSSHLCLSFNIYHSLSSQAHTYRDPGRLAELKVSQAYH